MQPHVDDKGYSSKASLEASMNTTIGVSPAPKGNMPPSYRDEAYVSDEMLELLELDCPDDVIPISLETIQYSNTNLFPEWLLSTSEWKKTKKVNSDNGNSISEILQTPHTQRTHDQVAASAKWLMTVWETAKSMGFGKCAAMTKEFKYFKHEAGENIITEGETGLTFYIIISGETQVIKDGIGVVATLGKGKSFGEIALTGKDTRTATIRALTTVEVLRLHKVDYDHFVRDIQLAERREHYHLLRECHLFDSWNRTRVDRISNTCKRKIFEPNTYIFKQGDEPDYVYIMLEGSVDIIKEVQVVCKNRWPSGVRDWSGCAKSYTKSFVMGTIDKRAAFFGELSILRDDKRSASCLATVKTTLVAIDRLEFIHMMEPGKQSGLQSNDLNINDSVVLNRVGHLTGGPSSFARAGECQVMPNVIKKSKPKRKKRVTYSEELISSVSVPNQNQQALPIKSSASPVRSQSAGPVTQSNRQSFAVQSPTSPNANASVNASANANASSQGDGKLEAHPSYGSFASLIPVQSGNNRQSNRFTNNSGGGNHMHHHSHVHHSNPYQYGHEIEYTKSHLKYLGEHKSVGFSSKRFEPITTKSLDNLHIGHLTDSDINHLQLQQLHDNSNAFDPNVVKLVKGENDRVQVLSPSKFKASPESPRSLISRSTTSLPKVTIGIPAKKSTKELIDEDIASSSSSFPTNNVQSELPSTSNANENGNLMATKVFTNAKKSPTTNQSLLPMTTFAASTSSLFDPRTKTAPSALESQIFESDPSLMVTGGGNTTSTTNANAYYVGSSAPKTASKLLGKSKLTYRDVMNLS